MIGKLKMLCPRCHIEMVLVGKFPRFAKKLHYWLWWRCNKCGYAVNDEEEENAKT